MFPGLEALARSHGRSLREAGHRVALLRRALRLRGERQEGARQAPRR